MIDLRRAKWQSRGGQAGSSMTIAEVHQQAAREQIEKSAAAAQASREAISRGGSRAGHARRDGQQPGEWQAVATGTRALQRPTDFSNIGRNISSSGSANPISFGPSSVFSKNRKPGAPGVVTPPLSRQPSTANMFGVLPLDPSEASKATSVDAIEPGPQRKKIALQPRTKPLPGEEGEGDVEGEGEGAEDETASEDEVSTPAETTMGTSTDAVSKIASDMKELWGEKDVGGSRNPEDIVEYFRALPEDHRPKLAERLVEDVFRIAKPKDADVVGKGWTAALEQGVATVEALKQGSDPHSAESACPNDPQARGSNARAGRRFHRLPPGVQSDRHPHTKHRSA